MKYISALKKYNEGSDKWCMPRRGSVDYLKIIQMTKKNSNSKSSSAKKSSIKLSSSSKYSHSFKSKSSSVNVPRSKDYEIVDDNPKIYLINAIGDGDCFINAIFDYGLYTGNLEVIYNRLINVELLILSKATKAANADYGKGIEKARELFNGFSIVRLKDYIKKYNYHNDKEEYSRIVNNSLYKIRRKDAPSKYKKLSKNLRYFTHGDKTERRKGGYDKERKLFSKAMKYIQVLYIYTIGKKMFLNRLKRSMDIAISAEGLEVLDWDHTLINYLKNKYYKRNGDLKATIDVNKLLDEYMKIYAETDGYFTGDDQIFIFRNIFFKRIKLKGSEDTIIPRFWLNNETIISVNNSTKLFKFIEKAKSKNTGSYKFLEKEDNYYNYISLLRDGEHYLLFVVRAQTKLNEFPNILINKE
jgi:hypothetical protein